MNASTEPTLGTTDPDSVQGRVLRVVATSRRLPTESVTSDSTFEQLGIDSLDRINLLFDLENEFDISIDDEEAKTITTIPQMVTGIQQLLQSKESGLASI
ncbi:acyl carrier protein [Granulicella sp. WH15]|uniref:phosphopantetheine-binding protein n=1 Tax=Granulicella sp. WH15 TaxID=2602070 RepID=UPI001367686A|nr:phosphopantetheine-binding protein [Granulicella sp. WH15]QHN04131.1 acyl carrier protein [Granulicella sp. WH15]